MIKQININDINLEVINEELKTFLSTAGDVVTQRAGIFDENIKFVLDGEQWTESERLERLGKSMLTFNNCEDYVYRYLVKLFPFSSTGVLQIGVKVHENDKVKKEQYEGEILTSYRLNGLSRKVVEQGTNFLVGGAGCLYYPLDPLTGKVKIISLDPKTVYLGWSGDDIITFAFKEDIGDNKQRITLWTLSNCFIFEGDVLIRAYSHDFGFIPASWIPNYPKPHKHEGRSKIASLMDLDREFNFRASDYSNRVDNNTEPDRVIFSDKVGSKDSEKFDRGKKQTHFLGKDDDMRYLELKEGPEVLGYLNKLDDKFRSKTGLVESAGAVKSAVSGVSISFQYSDMMDQIGFMRVFWDEAFVKMNRAILTYKFGQGEYDSEPVYSSALLFDTKQKVEEYKLMLDMGVISRFDAIEELRGAENAGEKITEILEENAKFNPPVPDDTIEI